LDEDLLRSILMDIQAHQAAWIQIPLTMSGERQRDQHEARRLGHALLLCEGGLAEQIEPPVFKLTEAGHDMLRATRTESRWRRVKERAGGRGVDALRRAAEALLAEDESAARSAPGADDMRGAGSS
jgi:hypothetical protein